MISVVFMEIIEEIDDHNVEENLFSYVEETPLEPVSLLDVEETLLEHVSLYHDGLPAIPNLPYLSFLNQFPILNKQMILNLMVLLENHLKET